MFLRGTASRFPVKDSRGRTAARSLPRTASRSSGKTSSFISWFWVLGCFWVRHIFFKTLTLSNPSPLQSCVVIEAINPNANSFDCDFRFFLWF
jgi:hypothetical protein